MARKIAIVQPLAFTITGSTNVTNVSNLLTADPKEAATITSGTTGTVDIDLGSNQSIDSALAGFLSSNITNLTVTYGTVTPTDSTLAAAFGGQSSVLKAPTFHRPFVANASVTARYLRFSIVSPTSAGTVGVLAVGLSVPITWGHELGGGRPIEDTGNAERLLSGGFGIYDGVRVGGYQWTFGDLFDTEVEALYGLSRDLGQTRSVLVIEDPTQSSGLNERTHWGLFDRLETYERGLPGASKYAFKVRDWA